MIVTQGSTPSPESIVVLNSLRAAVAKELDKKKRLGHYYVIGDRQAGAYRTVNAMAAGTNYHYPDTIKIPDLMANFGDWLTQPSLNRDAPSHPVEIATEIHARLDTLRPFTDGNGRTARLLMNLHLLRMGYPIAIIPARDRVAYLEAIVAWQTGNPHPLQLTVANCVKASALEILSLVNQPSQ